MKLENFQECVHNNHCLNGYRGFDDSYFVIFE